MEISGKQIAEMMKIELKKEVQKLKKRGKSLTLTVLLIGDSPDQLSFVRMKAKVAKELGIEYDLLHMKDVPNFEHFMHCIKEKTNNPKTTGIIIQQPLPAQLETESIFDFVPHQKEIECHQKKSFFMPPIGLAILTFLKFIYGSNKYDKQLFINPSRDKTFFKRVLRNKKIVMIGRGVTGGHAIGRALSEFGIPYIITHSATPNPEEFYREADIIITAVGRKVITPDLVKPGVILLNVGLRRENGKLRGDYDEQEIKDIASFYTPTPGGVGPVDVLYLYKNLIEASKIKKKK